MIGKTLRNATKPEAKAAIWGITCGNDVSERDWQNGPAKDLQWWRAKGADTFGPVGPWVVKSENYGNLILQTRLNGEVVQKQNTSDLLFDCETMVEFDSRYVTWPVALTKVVTRAVQPTEAHQFSAEAALSESTSIRSILVRVPSRHAFRKQQIPDTPAA